MSDDFSNTSDAHSNDGDDIELDYQDTEDSKSAKSKKHAQNSDELLPEEDIVTEDEHPTQAIAKLREKLKKAIAEKQEYLDGWQRTKADFVNFRRRQEESQKEIVNYASEDVLMQLMPVLDSFTMAFSNKEAWEKVEKNWRVGVEYIYAQLLGILQQNGFKEFDPKGEQFDPVKHVAIESVPVHDKSQEHKVVQVIQKGYELNGKIIRPARVKIGEFHE